MKRTYSILAVLIVFAFTLGVATTVSAAERMTYEEFQKQLTAYQARETAANQAIAGEQQKITDLKAQIADVEKQITAVWDQIYAYLKVTRDQVDAFNKKLDAVESKLNELSRLTPEQLLARVNDLDTLTAQINELAKDPCAKLTIQHNRVQQFVARAASLKASVPKPKNDLYSVIKGDYLWKISGKKDIFGDPWKWLRIWSYNRTTIKNPDLIYPKQELTIPRQLTKDEYIVVKGDNLKKIAGRSEVYGDPFQWTKLYQANKSGQFLSDSKNIYPEMILSIPR
jgi:nucleoid-associated protein YgaU